MFVLKYFLASAFIHAIALSAVFAQVSAPSQNLFLSAVLKNAGNETIEDQRSIYSGPSYDQYFTRLSSQGHPYYSELKSLFIEYNQVEYRSVTFLYDVFLDEIVVLRPDEKNWVMLDKDLVTQFNLAGHAFRKFPNVAGLDSGFYEIIVDRTNIRLVAKWSKTFRASRWKERVRLYIIKDHPLPVDTKKELLKALNDKEDEVRQFIKSNRLTFKQNKIDDLSKVVRYYSSLIK